MLVLLIQLRNKLRNKLAFCRAKDSAQLPAVFINTPIYSAYSMPYNNVANCSLYDLMVYYLRSLKWQRAKVNKWKVNKVEDVARLNVGEYLTYIYQFARNRTPVLISFVSTYDSNKDLKGR